jgi:YteA family regulatory protein
MQANVDYTRYKDLLLTRKREVESQLGDNDHYGMEASLSNSTSELSLYDNHPADNATDLYEREKDLALNEHTEEELHDIEQALTSMENGTYGTCKTCGQEINPERLEAIPTTLYCKEHSIEQAVSTGRPVEEDILSSPFEKFENDQNDDANFTDAEDILQSVLNFGTSETPSDYPEQSSFHYNAMFEDSEEPIGYVEDIESFLGNDIYGNNVKVYPNATHEHYEEMLDDEGVMSVTGNLGAPTMNGYDTDFE